MPSEVYAEVFRYAVEVVRKSAPAALPEPEAQELTLDGALLLVERPKAYSRAAVVLPCQSTSCSTVDFVCPSSRIVVVPHTRGVAHALAARGHVVFVARIA